MRTQRGTGKSQTAAVAVALLAFFVPLVAGDIDFTARVDRTTVGLGEQLTLTVTVTGTNAGRVPRPRLPVLPDFDQLGTNSSQSTSISFVNGRMTQQQTTSYIYYLSPKRTGGLSIGAARLEVGGEVYETQPIAVTVTKESQAQAPPPAAPGPGGFWDQFQRPPSQPSTPAADNVHVLASADRTTAYQGEQVTVSYSFYTRTRVGELQVAEMPSFSGFWVESVFDARELDYQEREYRGARYSAALIKKVALFPTRAGELTVGAMKMAGTVVRPGGFFFESAEPFLVSSSPITVDVKPLPDAGKPASFSGGVGQFELSARLDRDSSTGGEPVNLTVAVSGTGNIKLIGVPEVPRMAGVRMLDPETKDDVGSQTGRLKGTREFVYPIMPQADGRFSVPSIEMGFFDPEKQVYYTRTTPPLEFTVSGAGLRSEAAGAQTGGVRVVGTDIVHIKPVRAAGLPPRPVLAGWNAAPPAWSLGFYPLGIALMVLGIVVGRHRRRLEQDRGYARMRRSSGLVKKRLAEATAMLRQGREADFHAALDRAVLGYIGDRFNVEAQRMTGDELRAELTGRGVATGTAVELLDLIRTCDAARFSPGMASCRPDETLARARRVLEAL